MELVNNSMSVFATITNVFPSIGWKTKQARKNNFKVYVAYLLFNNYYYYLMYIYVLISHFKQIFNEK